ncbi:MAG: hypothetical protein WBW04_15625 [Nitrolancea sp.]
MRTFPGESRPGRFGVDCHGRTVGQDYVPFGFGGGAESISIHFSKPLVVTSALIDPKLNIDI